MAPATSLAIHRSRPSVLLGCLLLTACSFGDIYSTKKGPNLKAIESTVADRLISQHIPGAALIIVKDGKLVDMKCFGYRDLSQMLPVTPVTPFCIGSCTKGFTVMAVEMAVDAGVVSLNDHPSKYLPEFKLKDPQFNNKVTLRDFISRRAEEDTKPLALDWNDTSPKKMLHVISGVRPHANTSEQKLRNANLNICVAGYAVAAASGTSYEKLIQDSIFRPLAMNDSRLSSDIRLAEDAHGHILDKHAQPTRYERALDEIFQPESGIVSSARDMAKWLGLLTADGVFEGKRLVSERGFNELFEPLLDSKSDFTSSLGWSEKTITGSRIVAHSGGAPGYCASITILPDRHIGVVLLTNLGPESAEVQKAIPAWILSQLVSTID